MKKNLNETGAYKKPWANRVKIALVYPNTYSVGMSSLGFQTIYRLLNEKPFITCERFFLDQDSGGKLKSLESARGLSEYDFVFFSVSYSTDFINIFHMLQKSGISLLGSERRDSRSPILGAGGTAIYINPEPLSPVFDIFFLGEAESFIESFTKLVDGKPATVKSKSLFLDAVRWWEGVYIPGDLEVEYSENGSIKDFKFKRPGVKIKRKYEKDLNSFATHSSLFSDSAEFGSIFMEEISRGCARACRFCAIGFVGSPFRTRSQNMLFKYPNPGLKVGIVGAAISDHPKIKDISRHIIDSGRRLSFSSFRIDRIDPEIIEILKKSGIKTFTIAPETGSERLRKIINKNLCDEEIMQAIKDLRHAGIKNLKLYFMVGLPFESKDDIRAIIGLCKNISAAFDHGRINVSVNPFIPKPFTPLQWSSMQPKPYLKNIMTDLKTNLSSKNVRLESASITQATIDAIFSKGDRRLGEKIIFSVSQGKTIKDELLKIGKSQKSFIYREINFSEKLPWDFIDNGVDKSFLWKEFEKAKELASTTDPCKTTSDNNSECVIANCLCHCEE